MCGSPVWSPDTLEENPLYSSKKLKGDWRRAPKRRLWPSSEISWMRSLSLGLCGDNI